MIEEAIDLVEGATEIELPAGRVQPSAYAKFQEFARQADEALFHGVRVRLL